jgi:hypothetical protein
MSNRKKSIEEEEQQDEMTVVILRYKGNSQTLQKGFDTVSQALMAIGGQPPALPARRPQSLPAVHTNGNDAIERDETLIDTPKEAAPEAPRSSRAAGTWSRKPKFNSKLDFTGNGKPWKAFAAEKNPQADNDKYLIAALWLQEHAKIEPFTASDIFSCFRTMEWKELEDFTYPMRYLRQTKSYFDIPKRGQWKLNQHGVEAAKAFSTPA